VGDQDVGRRDDHVPPGQQLTLARVGELDDDVLVGARHAVAVGFHGAKLPRYTLNSLVRETLRKLSVTEGLAGIASERDRWAAIRSLGTCDRSAEPRDLVL